MPRKPVGTSKDRKDRFLRMVDGYSLRKEARSLLSDDNENVEYDRAVVELVTFALGGDQDDIRDIGAQLGLTDKYITKMYADGWPPRRGERGGNAG